MDDLGLSVHAAFFDYDNDGDLDCYLLNNSLRSVSGYDLIKDQREIRDPEGGNKLYRNDGGTYSDVSAAAGIYGSNIGFGLGVTIGDIDRDGWLDIYVSNDFFERDYLYQNQGDGTFREVLEDQIREISMGSMGADMADINNDGYPDIFVTDMLPERDDRIKTKTVFENWDKYQLNLKNGYYHQFTRNVLQLNNGNNTFSEISRLAGVHATDWSWGALIFDLDNDGLKDIFVANGIAKDLMDLDYVNFYANPQVIRSMIEEEDNVITKLIDAMPSEPLANYAFINNGDLTFTNQSADLGLAHPSFSNGSAYGDLDNDGDLDLVTNNIDQPAFIYRNETDTLLPDHHYLTLNLVGQAPNTYALGAQVTIYHDGNVFYQEQNPMRGFQSTVDHRIHFGLGELETIDSLYIRWPNAEISFLQNVSTDQQLTIRQEEGANLGEIPERRVVNTPFFKALQKDELIPFTHEENTFVDFDRERLIHQMTSREGPKISVADVNGDGREDVFLGGAKDQAGALFIQQPGGHFLPANEEAFQADAKSEDTDCLFFDADGDGDMDLYVASGGSEFSSSSSALMDRLYLNDGRGSFSEARQILPARKFESTSCVDAADFDKDGDLDLFIGIRLKPFQYGVPVGGYIMENDGQGNFSDISTSVAPELATLGMITDAKWIDVDGDQDQDLIVVGDWMAITIFQNDGGTFVQSTGESGLANTRGFWNCLEVADLNQDNRPDLILGNHGLNSRDQGFF